MNTLEARDMEELVSIIRAMDPQEVRDRRNVRVGGHLFIAGLSYPPRFYQDMSIVIAPFIDFGDEIDSTILGLVVGKFYDGGEGAFCYLEPDYHSSFFDEDAKTTIKKHIVSGMLEDGPLDSTMWRMMLRIAKDDPEAKELVTYIENLWKRAT